MSKKIINYRIFDNNVEFVEWQLDDQYEGIISISPYTKPSSFDFDQTEKREGEIFGSADINMEQGVFVVYTERDFSDDTDDADDVDSGF